MTGPALEPADIVLVYGRDTCEDTTRARDHLERAGVPFRYLRVDEDETARTLVHGAGFFATPVVVAPTGTIHVEPTDEELDAIVTSATSAPSAPSD
jgi:mycoredoxin